MFSDLYFLAADFPSSSLLMQFCINKQKLLVVRTIVHSKCRSNGFLRPRLNWLAVYRLALASKLVVD